jgi:uncharacterized HhH-GPD family protein
MTEIHFTTEPAANTVLADNHFALLVGMTLYQQVPVEKAFAGPSVLEERIGKPLDAHTIASMDPQTLEDAFKEKPALHRFPANMAKRTQAVANYIVDTYDGETSGLWTDVADNDEFLKRLLAMPGFGDYKARVYAAVLARQFDIKPKGWDASLPEWPNISEVTSDESRIDMKARKKVWKTQQG